MAANLAAKSARGAATVPVIAPSPDALPDTCTGPAWKGPSAVHDTFMAMGPDGLTTPAPVISILAPLMLALATLISEPA